MDRYAIALNKPITDVLMKGVKVKAFVKAAYISPEPACHYECTNLEKKGCAAESSLGWLCSRSAGHDGPHVACADRHERHIWHLPGEDVSAGEGPYR